MKLIIIAALLLVSSMAFSAAPKHELTVSSTGASIVSGSGSTVTTLQGRYGYKYNSKIQILGTLGIVSSNGTNTTIGIGGRYNFNPEKFMRSWYAQGLVTFSSASGSDTTFAAGGGRRIRLSRDLAFTPEAWISTAGSTTNVIIYPVAFSWAFNKLKFSM